MKILLNGQKKDNSAANLKELVQQHCPRAQHVVAEVNNNIVRQPEWEKTVLAEGDRVELVTLMGGG